MPRKKSPRVAQLEEYVLQQVRDGRIEVRTDGTVWRVSRLVKGPAGTMVPKPGPLRRIGSRPSGNCRYCVINIRKSLVLTHRIVYQTLVGEIPEGLTVNHINGIKTDNRPENLELLSMSDNIKHAFRIGLMSNSGEKHPAARLTAADVLAIRRTVAAGASRKGLAERYGVCGDAINKIVARTRWKHVTDEPGEAETQIPLDKPAGPAQDTRAVTAPE